MAPRINNIWSYLLWLPVTTLRPTLLYYHVWLDGEYAAVPPSLPPSLPPSRRRTLTTTRDLRRGQLGSLPSGEGLASSALTAGLRGCSRRFCWRMSPAPSPPICWRCENARRSDQAGRMSPKLVDRGGAGRGGRQADIGSTLSG